MITNITKGFGILLILACFLFSAFSITACDPDDDEYDRCRRIGEGCRNIDDCDPGYICKKISGCDEGACIKRQ